MIQVIFPPGIYEGSYPLRRSIKDPPSYSFGPRALKRPKGYSVFNKYGDIPY
jgi:hypothetical protein